MNFKNIFLVAVVAIGIGITGCSGGGDDTPTAGSTGGSTTTGGTAGPTITALDGYIKNATLKDASGQTATYSGAGGKYVFASSVTYPLTLTGGVYEDTNTSFDINMTCSSGSVLSPITTFIDGNSTVLGKLANLALSGNPASFTDFSVDYVDTNDTALAKLSQLLYVVAKDSNLTRTLREDMNVTSLSALYSHIESDINTSVTDTTLQNNMRIFVQKVKDINSSVPLSSYETTLKNDKNLFSTITWKGKIYGQVISPYTAKVWLDRNLGASRVATAFDDNQSYGDYYQWGRAADGHQESNSTTFATLASDINATNANGKFITNSTTPYDWVASGVDDNGSLREAEWSKTDGSSICPIGFRVPNISELAAETTSASFSVTNQTEAFNNFLKLASAGYRVGDSGSLNDQGSFTIVWSSSASGSGTDADGMSFSSNNAGTAAYYRGYGRLVRCLKD